MCRVPLVLACILGCSAANAHAVALASGDLNGDGQIDLLLESVQVDLATTFVETPRLTLYLGLPDGTLR